MNSIYIYIICVIPRTGEEMKVLASVGARRGRVLLFPHEQLHEGTAVERLPKLMLRADVKLGKGDAGRIEPTCVYI